MSNSVDAIYSSHSAAIHSIKIVEGFALETRGLLNEDQLKIMEIIIENSPWKGKIFIG